VRFDMYNHSVSPYNKQVIFVCLAGLAADQDFRAFHGADSEGISVWVSAKLAPIMGSRKCSEVNAATLQKTFVIMGLIRLSRVGTTTRETQDTERRAAKSRNG
jgi:hypothetical protein